jgi:ADP-ribosyl-[dinitrogen reductase] hydrolase
MMVIKTSESHPLRVDFVKPLSAPGKIGMTLCPGKHQDDGISGKWRRDLASDIRSIIDTGATALVTLVESHELDYLHVPHLGQQCQGAGLEWHHLPIEDQCAPDEPFELLWAQVGVKLRTSLRDGEVFVLHCMGGLGRAGTIAARLLVELGESPESAIERVRDARRGAIETRVQEDYVGRCVPVNVE